MASTLAESKEIASTLSLHPRRLGWVRSMYHWKLLSVISFIKLWALSSVVLIRVPPAVTSIMDLTDWVTIIEGWIIIQY